MANPEVFYTGNGTKTDYTFNFEYIDEDDIKVSLNDVVTTAYSFANATTILFSTAPASNVRIRIYRDTNVDSLKTTFFAGSSIRAQDLNKNFEQSNYAVQEMKAYIWDNETGTIHSDETWVSSDNQIATTAAIDARFQDEDTETITSAETWPDNDDTIATTAAIDNRIDTAITNDIGTDGTGITVTDDGDGTITLGLADNSIDFAKIQNVDIINQAEERAGSPAAADTNLYTALAANTRFDTLVQTTTPTRTDYPVGKTWLQNDDDLTLSVWNGSGWTAITSGGTFTSLSKVVYVDAVNGNDSSLGHRISNPKQTIRAAVQQINAETDAVGNGSVVIVAPGIYAETFPIDIEKNDVSIVGTSLRNCIVHPAIPAADQAGYDVDVPEANELSVMFRVNSGTYIQNLTLQGMKAAGPRGGNTLDTDATFGLPTNQGWNFAFLPGATIRKSPYIQNCTNFSDSQTNNVNFTPHVPGEGAAGDLDSAPTGGGALIDGSVPAAASPLRSMVLDSYTHTALDGPGIFVTNNGYVQATSSYAFFNHYHLKCLNGGQANLAASTTDFGRYSLIADGRSTTNIFTATLAANANDQATSFIIGAQTADASWHGAATRPQPNMLVELNGITYPILSSTNQFNATEIIAGHQYTIVTVGTTDYTLIGSPNNLVGTTFTATGVGTGTGTVTDNTGWRVTISRPNPLNRSNNLGLNGDISDGAAVQFFLRSQIASSGHTMEYVGSGTNYLALPENGGVPIEANQVVESNNGKIWTATTDHNGKFKVGDFFEVDQQLGYVTIPEGSIAFNLLSDSSPQLGGNLDVQSRTITSSVTNQNIILDPNGTGGVDVSNAQIINLADPTAAQNAATKNYVDTTTTANPIYVAVAGDTMSGALAMGTNKITGVGDPTAAQDAATKNYVDTELAGISSNSISQGDTNVTVTDNGTDPSVINFTVDNTNYGRFTNTGSLSLGNSLNVATGLGGTSIVSLNSSGVLLEGSGSGATNRAQVRFAGTTTSDYVSFRSPGNFTGTTVFNLPTADGTANQVLTTDGSGTLSFADAASPYPAKGASGTNQWAVVHSYTVDADYSIPSGSHVINAGPMTVNSGVTVTIPTGSNWTIV